MNNNVRLVDHPGCGGRGGGGGGGLLKYKIGIYVPHRV